jgi:hypothetical protein
MVSSVSLSLELNGKLARIGLDESASDELALVLVNGLQSDELFPIPFAKAWLWLGYSNKGNALRLLQGLRISGILILKGRDFLTTTRSTGAAVAVDYNLSTACFEALAINAATIRGQRVRDFFLAVKREYVAQLAHIAAAPDLPRLQATSSERSGKFKTDQCDQLTQPLPERVGLERIVASRLSAALAGEEQVQCANGRIDILTTTEVIEVKRFHLWKAAMGQVQVYREDFPKLGARLHLFATAEDDVMGRLARVSKMCAKFDVRVTFEVIVSSGEGMEPEDDKETDDDPMDVTWDED